MGKACRVYLRGGKCIQGFNWKTCGEETRRHRHRWEDNIRMYLEKRRQEDVG